ncbi:hypothetical protein L207DRAFT_53722 [Hyaloscypha variabilis F]|uniref:YMC020W-like alpha/beta hydrolase domain-containing protein n=1 Tax=Hyaloscypha variabilis (strain UAMH 11265 / GT02V1 / F) TaxID=1149755 RepID=A0A2J6RKW4_HYAVF|nr:hypothetical protein L207DRAFT_53722 [Hyaloscypha variabilis F]
MYLGKGKETLDITMGGTVDDDKVADKDKKVGESSSARDVEMGNTTNVPDVTEETSHEAPSEPAVTPVLEPDAPRPATSSGWLGGWLSRPTLQLPSAAEKDPSLTEARTLDAPPLVDGTQSEQTATEPLSKDGPKVTEPAASTSWFGLWSIAAPSTITETPTEQIPVKVKDTDGDVAMKDDAPPVKATAGSSWAFWSTEPPKKESSATSSENNGQLAVAGEASQSNPEPAKVTTLKDSKKPPAKTAKRGRPQSAELDEATRKVAQLSSTSSKNTPSQSPAPPKISPPNLLIPSVRSTYKLVENPSILQQIARLLLHGHQEPVKHVSLVKDPPKVKKALAIGIHGLFPAPLLRTIIGQPTGTSIKFANHAAAAIRRWTDKNGSLDCEIEKVALEGEGKIAERVDNLWKLLLNWIEHIRKADFILVACHSQGVPVAVMLVAKLVEFGVVSTGRIGICAMAGVSLGPFPDYKSKLFSGSAGELFEFADPESSVSKRYEDALRVAVKYGVRITYCGSIDDQLVSMESSIFSPVNHPYIYRAVFVDGRIHAPDFLSHLVGFALKLRNLGVSDHGLIRELSAPLAGSLYTGEGHSRLYDDEKVYDFSVEYALETTSVADVPLQLKKYEIPTNSNPYVLPWTMRGILEEDFVKTELDTEVTELLKQFDDWKPATKVLKDVKYRLEAVRSKL